MKELWPHQQRALDEIEQTKSNRVCIACPTGGGKTTIAIELIKRRATKNIFYTNRRMLLDQTSRVFGDLGLEHGILASGYSREYELKNQLAMLQSENITYQKTGDLFECDFIIIDEAHNNTGPTCMKMYDFHANFHGSQIIGLTATPIGIGHAFDKLIVAGTNSELRECGALVPAYTYAPDEPDLSLIGKVAVGEGECGINQKKRKVYAHRIFGSVIDHYRKLNPEQRPAVLFAPGVEESIWFTERFCGEGIKAAHIDGGKIYVDGDCYESTSERRKEIEERVREGEIKIVCNRFVLREGIDWPFIEHGIFATVFGSLTAYLQAGGRVIRKSDGFEGVTIQDHGGNWWRHGSLNADRIWELGTTNRIEYEKRADAIREEKEEQPIVCPKCATVRSHGSSCPKCGFMYAGKTRRVMTANGTLKMQEIGEFRKKVYQSDNEKTRSSWRGRVMAIRNSKRPEIRATTFAQLSARIARDNGWKYPRRDFPLMPKNATDFFRPIAYIPIENLRQ